MSQSNNCPSAVHISLILIPNPLLTVVVFRLRIKSRPTQLSSPRLPPLWPPLSMWLLMKVCRTWRTLQAAACTFITLCQVPGVSLSTVGSGHRFGDRWNFCATGLVERGLQWTSRSGEQVAAQLQGHLSFMEMQSSDIQTLQQVKYTCAVLSLSLI